MKIQTIDEVRHMKSKLSLLLGACLFLTITLRVSAQSQYPFKDPNLPIKERAGFVIVRIIGRCDKSTKTEDRGQNTDDRRATHDEIRATKYE